ncbi:hypothetical protein [Burkholderia stagnalis]|nr:hypothetical protein [Burkholderia stagnalis]KVL90581.1 hypothetical protein WT02_22125 [Burkholderia stagnalis]KVL93919.1 hypothetical protein WT03_15930 [Burkholderia stagnalis]KVM02342.1 hypothetical protein WT04_31690 [Burkholderia stagnalis]KWK05758.1 hypothetical protein WT76_17255 [Burkholderia stagnalis]KWO23443.1 hypothetical protein WT94_18215 [Burkholderia stagnalis]
MHANSIISRAALAAAIAGGAWLTAGTAIAQEGPARDPYGYAQPVPVADVDITIGMHGDRYWDGRRYWRHEEWMRRHEHEHDPWRHDDDRRLRPRDDEPRHGY